MIAVKLAKGDVVSTSGQAESNSTSATIDRKNVVSGAVGDENSWVPLRLISI